MRLLLRMNRSALVTTWAHLSTLEVACGFALPVHSHHTPPRTKSPRTKPAVRVPKRIPNSSLSSALSSTSEAGNCALMRCHPTYSCQSKSWVELEPKWHTAIQLYPPPPFKHSSIVTSTSYALFVPTISKVQICVYIHIFLYICLTYINQSNQWDAHKSWHV